MKEKIIILLVLVIPFGYFLVKYFLNQDLLYYLYCALILGIVEIILILWSRKLLLQFWSGIIFGCMFLDFVFDGINLDLFFSTWSSLNYYLLIPAISLVILGSVIQTFRWKIILTNINRFKFVQLFPSVFVGHSLNHILPAKAGELIKCYHLGKKYD